MNKTNYNNIQDKITEEIKEHISVLNHNSQTMQVDIAVIKNTLKNHDKLLYKMDKRQWFILSVIIINILMGILMFVMKG